MNVSNVSKVPSYKGSDLGEVLWRNLWAALPTLVDLGCKATCPAASPVVWQPLKFEWEVEFTWNMENGFTGSCICRWTSRHGDKRRQTGNCPGRCPPFPYLPSQKDHLSFPTKFDHSKFDNFTQLLASRKDEARCNARKPNYHTCHLIQSIQGQTNQWPVTTCPLV